MSRGPTLRKVVSMSAHCTVTAVARKRTTAGLLLIPADEGVTLAGLELRLHSNSRGETTGMTSPTKVESFKTPGFFSFFPRSYK